MGDLVVLHAVGAADAGSPWREAFSGSTVWDRVWVPDLPGHAGEAAPAGGMLERTDAAYVVMHDLAQRPDHRYETIVGVGNSGWVAQVLALAGLCESVVLVDGVGAPFMDMAARNARNREVLRSLAAASPGELPPPPQGHGDEELARHAAASMPVPALLLGDDIASNEQLAPAFAAGATVEPASKPLEVVDVVAAWVRGLPS